MGSARAATARCTGLVERRVPSGWTGLIQAAQGRPARAVAARPARRPTVVALQAVLGRFEWPLWVGEVLLDPPAELLFGVKRGLRASLLKFGRVARVALLG